jgi:serine/threonine protein kinase
MRVLGFTAGLERTASVPLERAAAAPPEARSGAVRAPPFVGSVGAALGGGGTATVLHGEDAARRPVALKMLKRELARHPHAERLLEHEARMLASVRHPNVVACRGVVRLPDGRLALALDYLAGGDLVSLAGAAPALWADAALAVAAALGHCHARGVVHGDVRARNVLFAADDSARLVDFASARRVADGASPATDARAFAALVYELVTGAPLPSGAEPVPPAAPAESTAAGRIAAAVADVLAERHPAGLLPLTDVLESARRR